MKISVVGLRGFPKVQGGIETHCEKLYPILAEQGFDITTYGRKNYLNGKSKFIYKKCKIIPLPSLRNSFLETVSYMLFCLIRIFRDRPDIVHIHAIGPGIFAPLFKLLKVRVVLTHHGQDYCRGKWGFFARRILKIGEHLGVKYADSLIVLNECQKELLAKKCPHNHNISVIPNGVEIPDKKCVGSGNFVFAIGRFVEEKGFINLIEAHCLCGRAELTIAGKADHDSQYSKRLVEVAKKHNVKLAGFVQGEEKERLFLECRLFVIPSYHEGLPFTLLEAMASGCDILASDIPAHRELGLPEDCYFPAGDVKKLAEKITERLKLPFAPHNYDGVLKERYDWENIAEQTADVYRGLYADT